MRYFLMASQRHLLFRMTLRQTIKINVGRANGIFPKCLHYKCFNGKFEIERRPIGSTISYNSLLDRFRNRRSLHTTRSMTVAQLLSAEEIFSKKSLCKYLNNIETEYNDYLKVLSMTETQQGDEEELKLKRAKVSVLAPLVQCIRELESKQKEFSDTAMLLKDEDPDMRELAGIERDACNKRIQDLREKILSHLIPAEEVNMNDLVLEVTAGVGGQEAMLFTAEMFDMYQKYAGHQGWAFEVLQFMRSESGGLRNATASISGSDSYKRMKFEAGVHRVQRVPKTERQGRIHTSTMTVAVLPQPTEITFTINAKDLKIETTRASGAGGQHVNTTDSAVRIVHLPTGMAAECQQERSQLKNKETAMKVLRAKLYSMRLEEENSKRYNARKVQIGTKGRSEKIRTYNFPQDRITDHRIGKTVHDVRGFLLGEELLEDMSVSLLQFSDQETLMEILKDKDFYG